MPFEFRRTVVGHLQVELVTGAHILGTHVLDLNLDLRWDGWSADRHGELHAAGLAAELVYHAGDRDDLTTIVDPVRPTVVHGERWKLFPHATTQRVVLRRTLSGLELTALERARAGRPLSLEVRANVELIPRLQPLESETVADEASVDFAPQAWSNLIADMGCHETLWIDVPIAGGEDGLARHLADAQSAVAEGRVEDSLKSMKQLAEVLRDTWPEPAHDLPPDERSLDHRLRVTTESLLALCAAVPHADSARPKGDRPPTRDDAECALAIAASLLRRARR